MKSDITFYSDFENSGEYLQIRDNIKKVNDEVCLLIRNKNHECIAKISFDKTGTEELILELMKLNITLTS